MGYVELIIYTLKLFYTFVLQRKLLGAKHTSFNYLWNSKDSNSKYNIPTDFTDGCPAINHLKYFITGSWVQLYHITHMITGIQRIDQNKWNESDRERQRFYDCTCMWNLKISKKVKK